MKAIDQAGECLARTIVLFRVERLSLTHIRDPLQVYKRQSATGDRKFHKERQRGYGEHEKAESQPEL